MTATAQPATSSTIDDVAGLLAGLAASTLATAGMLIAGVTFEHPTVAETFADAISATTPVHIVEGMIAVFGSSAKRILFGGVLLGQIAVGGGLGLIAERARWSPRRLTIVVAAVAACAAVVGLLGGNGRSAAGPFLASLLLTAGLFGATYWAIWRALHPSGIFAAEEAAARRTFLKKATIAVGALAGGSAGLRFMADRLTPAPVPPVLSAEVARTSGAISEAGTLGEALQAGVPGLAPEITPNDTFYVVSKNVFRDPNVNEQNWRLEVVGLVARPMILSYGEMTRLPASNQYFTLQCISNEVGGDLIGNAAWRGIALGDLLLQAGVRDTAVDVVFRAADDYSDSIPIQKAMQTGTMLAYEMNGEILPKSHGFPVRLLVPDIYGMKNVKWITQIEVVDYDYKGFWQNGGWSDVATMKTTSRIDAPKSGSFLRPGRNYVGGIAIAGQRGVQAVEVSTDGGRSWGPAAMKPALGPNTWVLWLYEWELLESESATQKLLVRATDGTGVLQSPTVTPTLPDGASGYHAVVVRRTEAQTKARD